MKLHTILAVAALSTPVVALAAPHTVKLTTGEQVTGEIVSRSEKQIVVDSAGVGEVTIPAGKIANVIGPDGKDAPYVPVTDDGLFGLGILAGWERTAELGATGTSGTTDSAAINALFNATTDNDSYRSTFGAWYFLSTDNGGTSRNQTRVYATYDHKIDGGPWFVFGKAQYDNDSLALWENRVSLYFGPGYEFVKKDNYDLVGRIGVGYAHEFGGNTPSDYDDSRFEALIGFDGKWKVDSNSSFSYGSYYYPSLEDFMGEGRVISYLAYMIDISKSRGLSFKIGTEHTYDFVTPGDDEHNNWKYYANLVMKM
jgi:putative salt-induced outer membrane protein YdiY